MHSPGRLLPHAQRTWAFSMLAMALAIAAALATGWRDQPPAALAAGGAATALSPIDGVQQQQFAFEPARAGTDDPQPRQFQHSVISGADAASAWSAMADVHGN